MTLMSILMISGVWSADLKPYVLGTEGSLTVSETAVQLKSGLSQNGFEIIGEYAPASDDDRWVLVVTSDELKSSVKQFGGLTGFAAALRVAVTKEGTKTVVSYVNPEYLGNAYYRKNYNEIQPAFAATAAKLKSAVSVTGPFIGTPFGSEDGLEPKKIQKYHYMFGMEYFDDVVKLNKFSSFNAAVEAIESNLSAGTKNVDLVYSIAFPDQELKLYGLALSGETGEEHFMPIIDISSPKHTAFLPYEILVKGNEVVMMHGRYRIALSFPDLTMMTFGKIMSTPSDIKDLMKSVTK